MPVKGPFVAKKGQVETEQTGRSRQKHHKHDIGPLESPESRYPADYVRYKNNKDTGKLLTVTRTIAGSRRPAISCSETVWPSLPPDYPDIRP